MYRRVVAVGALVAMALSACASPKSERTATPLPELANVQMINDASQVHRPIDKWVLTADQLGVIVRGRDRLVLQCLQRTDAASSMQEPDTIDAFIQAALRDRVVRADLYGFFDTENVARDGYHRPANEPESFVVNFPGVSDTLSEQCQNEAKLATRDLNASSTDGALPDGGPRVPTEDPRYQTIVSKWHDCMHERGFEYSTPLAASADPTWAKTAAPTDRELNVAKADVDCKRSTNLVGVGLALETSYDNLYVDSHTPQLGQWQAENLALIKHLESL